MKGLQITSKSTVKVPNLKCQEKLQATKSNYIKYTAYSKSYNMNTVNTGESTIWNPLVISLDINLGYTYFFSKK